MEEVGNIFQVPIQEQSNPACLDGLVQETSCDIPSGLHPYDTPNIITSNLPSKKGRPNNKKGSKPTSTLGLQKMPFKKGICEKSTESGRKMDQEKVKMMEIGRASCRERV